jgi:hypothetical protein
VLHGFRRLEGQTHLHELKDAVANTKKSDPPRFVRLSHQNDFCIKHFTKIVDRGLKIPTSDANMFNRKWHLVYPPSLPLSFPEMLTHPSFFFAHDRGKSPPRLHKARIEGKRD